jgi:NADH-quinone oxidoreductase subunit E
MDTHGTHRADKKNIDEYRKKIKNSGLRLTETRMIILNTFIESQRNLSAEELFLLSHKKYPKIGQATIYRNLKMLEEEGIIEKAGYKDNRAIYRMKECTLSDDSNKSYIKSEISREKASGKISKKVNKKGSEDEGTKESKRESKNATVKADSRINRNSGSNIVNTESNVKSQLDSDYVYRSDYERTLESYMDMEKIKEVQDRLAEWLSDLKKIKREKELELEDTIEDFGKVDRLINSYQNKGSNLIQILLKIQSEYRWLPKHILLYISNKLNIPLTNIYDIATFYKFFNLEPQGRHSIVVCMGTACHVRGATNLLQRVVNVLGIKPGDTTSDYNFTLSTVNCLGCCALGPVMMVDNKYYSNPQTAKLKKILNQFQ